ncbi:unnamed protein product, partial [Polarella glacialis]
MSRSLPRDGASPGGGKVFVVDREQFNSSFQQGDESMQLSRSSHSLPSSPAKVSSWANSTSPIAGSRTTGRSTWGCSPAQARKKLEQVYDVRKQDMKLIADKLDRRSRLRESRSERLLAATTGSFGADYEISVKLRDLQGREEQRRRELHAEREKEVFQPIADRLSGTLHLEQDRRERQAVSGERHAAFSGSPVKVGGRGVTAWRLEESDPVHRPALQHAQEEAFHREAMQVVSVPLQDLWALGLLAGHGKSCDACG